MVRKECAPGRGRFVAGTYRDEGRSGDQARVASLSRRYVGYSQAVVSNWSRVPRAVLAGRRHGRTREPSPAISPRTTPGRCRRGHRRDKPPAGPLIRPSRHLPACCRRPRRRNPPRARRANSSPARDGAYRLADRGGANRARAASPSSSIVLGSGAGGAWPLRAPSTSRASCTSARSRRSRGPDRSTPSCGRPEKGPRTARILCEVNGGPRLAPRLDSQESHEPGFFERHLKPWAPRFFCGLGTLPNVVGYRASVRWPTFFEIEAYAFEMGMNQRASEGAWAAAAPNITRGGRNSRLD